MTLWAWSSVMRNSAFRTVTTNSRGVKSSLTRMTLCSFGRSVLVLTLVFGLATASIIPAAPPARQVASVRIQLPGLPWNRPSRDGFIAARHAASRVCHRRDDRLGEIKAAGQLAANLNVKRRACSGFSTPNLRVTIAGLRREGRDALVCLD